MPFCVIFKLCKTVSSIEVLKLFFGHFAHITVRYNAGTETVMNSRQLNTNIAIANLEGIPGFYLSRSDIEERLGNPGWLKSIGGIVCLNRDAAFVIPAGELPFVSLSQLDQIGLPRLINHVVSEKGGFLPLFSGPVHMDWRRTLSMIDLSKLNFDGGHWVRNFEPEYNGSLVAYHGILTESGEYRDREFKSINGQAICRFDYLAHEGQNYMAAVTFNPETQERTTLLRQTPIKAILNGESVSTKWTPAPWAEGYNVVGLRGSIEDGNVGYGFRDTKTNIFYTATPDSKEATKRLEHVKGVLIGVTGAMEDLSLMPVITEDNKVHAINLFGGRDDVVLDLDSEEYAEVTRDLSDSTSFIGTVSKGVLWLQGNAPFADLMVISRPSLTA